MKTSKSSKGRNTARPVIKVEVYLGDKILAPSDYKDLCIKSPEVDRIVNSICDSCNKAS